MPDESESEVLIYYEMGNVLVVYERGAVVGLAHVVEEAGALEIVNLAVVPERRGQGISKRLIEEVAGFSRLSNVLGGSWSARGRGRRTT